MLNQARYNIIQQLHSTHHNRLWGGCLANMAAHHWTSILKSYHVSCCILRFSFVPNNIIMHVPGCSLVEPHNSLSFVSYITQKLGSPIQLVMFINQYCSLQLPRPIQKLKDPTNSLYTPIPKLLTSENFTP